MAKRRRWIWVTLIVLAGLLVGFVVVAVGGLLYVRIPQNAAGMAAKTICSLHFVSGRPGTAEELMTADVLPASPALATVSASINEEDHSVTARFLGVVSRRASFLDKRGCVLDEDPQPGSTPYVAQPASPAPWPDGSGATGASPALQQVVDAVFVGSGDPTAANARALAVVHGGRLLIEREGTGFTANTALHGWSMTKTVTGWLAYTKLAEAGIDLQSPVVDAFPSGREPAWVAQWRQDERRAITIADLFFMRDGLANDEGYGTTGSVVQMLYGEPDMAAWAATHPAGSPAGTTWQYLSATSNILADVVKAQFATDEEYWDYPRTALFDPLGITTATLETDTTGTWVSSSYLWASADDWARLGQAMMTDTTGWREFAATPALPSGPGHGYGAQTWLPGEPTDGECSTYPGIPADTLMMEGHWGQLVAMVPSRDTVIVRLGWTFDKSTFDGCQLISDVLGAIPAG